MLSMTQCPLCHGTRRDCGVQSCRGAPGSKSAQPVKAAFHAKKAKVGPWAEQDTKHAQSGAGLLEVLHLKAWRGVRADSGHYATTFQSHHDVRSAKSHR